jgi:phospholipase C
VLAYAPASETGIYQQLLEKWAFADNVLQANEGPSFVAHQYFIAAQSGGLPGALTSPDAEAENPQTMPPSPVPTGDYVGTDDEDSLTSAGCNPTTGYIVKTIDMAIPLPSNTPWDNGSLATPCEEYNTILDEIGATEGIPPIADWQYIAYENNTIWAAPLGVRHLYQQWQNGQQMFTVDPDAEQFVSDIQSSNPSRPFASLTYITECPHESDHPELSGTDDAPEWLAWVLNAIGQSKYWDSTAIIVMWDDWGGWFDNVPDGSPTPNATPFRPNPNPYDVSPDPNEWGFRVPLFVISPYIKERGFVSSQATSGFQYRSQSVVLQFIEAIFGVASLNGDDEQQNQADGLKDVFNMSPTPSPLPYVAVTDPPSWTPPSGEMCPTNGGSSARHRHAAHRRMVRGATTAFGD